MLMPGAPRLRRIEENVKSVLSVCICKQRFDMSKYAGLGGTPVYVGADRYYKGFFNVFSRGQKVAARLFQSAVLAKVFVLGLLAV